MHLNQHRNSSATPVVAIVIKVVVLVVVVLEDIRFYDMLAICVSACARLHVVPGSSLLTGCCTTMPHIPLGYGACWPVGNQWGHIPLGCGGWSADQEYISMMRSMFFCRLCRKPSLVYITKHTYQTCINTDLHICVYLLLFCEWCVLWLPLYSMA